MVLNELHKRKAELPPSMGKLLDHPVHGRQVQTLLRALHGEMLNDPKVGETWGPFLAPHLRRK
jgi:hypothetical protein